MESVVAKIRLAKSLFTGEYCLKTDKGKRLTCWFKTYEKTVIGDFVKLKTDIGNFVYHKNQLELLYECYVEGEEAYVYKLTDDIYYLQIDCSQFCSLVQLYYASGISINMSALEDVCAIGNDLIAAKEFCGDWGILDKDLNEKIGPAYEEVFDFTNGIATGYRSQSDTTDLISVDANGNIRIVNVDGYVLQILTKDFVISKKGDKKGVYNTKGEKILDFAYDGIRIVDNHFILTNNHLDGLADITGKILCECRCYQIGKTEQGFELVMRQIVETTEYITV